MVEHEDKTAFCNKKSAKDCCCSCCSAASIDDSKYKLFDYKNIPKALHISTEKNLMRGDIGLR